MTLLDSKKDVDGANGLAVRTKERFGKDLAGEFLFDGWRNMNHGSFGTYPNVVREVMRKYQDESETKPDYFIRYKYPQLLNESREAVAKLLHAPASTVVFLPNATTGINTVLRNLTFQPGEHILYFDTIYGACEKTVAYITETTPAQAVKVQYAYPVEDDWLVEQFKSKVAEVEAKGGKVKVAIFDTVVSLPGLRVPFEKLTQACKEAGVLSCIDGAHGVGHVELDMESLDPDFFVSNCHKWLHVPRGCAVFYVPHRNQHLMRSTLPTSHGFVPKSLNISSPLPKGSTSNPFVANFQFYATMDNSPYLCVPTAIAFRESLGGEEAVLKYVQGLALQGAQHVARELGTEILDNATRTLTKCCMANVRLPIDVAKAKQNGAAAGLEESSVDGVLRDWLNRTAVVDHDTYIQMFPYQGVWWARLSGQVYLDMSDYEWAAGVLKGLCKRANEGEWVAKSQA